MNKDRLIKAAPLEEFLANKVKAWTGTWSGPAYATALEQVKAAPTVDAVEVPDKKLLKAINLLIKQYEHSKNSEYVHSPVAHAFFHTWKQLDGRRE